MLVDLKSPCDVDLNPSFGRVSFASTGELGRGQGATPLIIGEWRGCRKGEFVGVIVGWLLVAAPV